MSLYIKGLDMPKDCFECPFKVSNGIISGKRIEFECVANGYTTLDDYQYDDKPSDCPLVEIPTPHGRLIDENELQELYADSDDLDLSNYDINIAVVRQNIKDMPAILESEE